MPQRATFIDNIVTKPLTGACFHFESVSAGEVLNFRMERSTALAVAYDILAAVEAADTCEVIPILGERPSQYRRAS